MWIIPEQAYFLPVSQINTSVYLNPLSDISGQIISNIVEPPKMAPLNTHHTSYSYIKKMIIRTDILIHNLVLWASDTPALSIPLYL